MIRPLAFCLAVIAGPVAAQTGVALGALTVDPKDQVEVTADQLSFDQDSGRAVFQGNVLAVQGDLRLSAGRVEVAYDAESGDVTRLTASGQVTFVTPAEAAEAARAVYDLRANTLTMEGDVLLTQGPNAIASERMVVDLSTGRAQLEGRVRTVIGGN